MTSPSFQLRSHKILNCPSGDNHPDIHPVFVPKAVHFRMPFGVGAFVVNYGRFICQIIQWLLLRRCF
jgi:hypothetical protein